MWINIQRGEKITSRQLSWSSVFFFSTDFCIKCHHTQSYSLINDVSCAVKLSAIKESWPSSTCVGSPYLAAKSLNYARRMRPSWKLKHLQQPSMDICIWWKFNPILSGQSTFHLLQFQSCCQERHPERAQLRMHFFTSTPSFYVWFCS